MDSQSFRHDAWLESYPLTEATVLDYFAWSPWYDKDCVNEQLKALGLPADAAAAQHLAGAEFALRRTGHERAGLFVIEKRVRAPGTAPVPAAVFAVVEGTVYPCPDLGALLAGRVARAAHHLAAATALVEQAQAAARAAAAAAGGGGGGGGGGAQQQQQQQQQHALDAVLHGLSVR